MTARANPAFVVITINGDFMRAEKPLRDRLQTAYVGSIIQQNNKQIDEYKVNTLICSVFIN